MASIDIPSPLSSIRCIELEVASDLAFPAIAVREKAVLVVVEFFARLGREFEIRPEHDRIDRTGFLAIAAIDALHHVDVVARGAAAAVLTGLGFDRDTDRGAYGLAELASDAAFLTVRIASERMLSAKAR